MGKFPPTEQNYYEMLGVPRDASPQEIKQAYLALVKRYHPDVNPAPNAHELFVRIQEAYQVLSDPEKRAAYDESLPPLPLTITTQLSRQALLRVPDPQLVYVLLRITPSEAAKNTNKRPPLNICLALDCSTSMKGKRLAALKRAASMLVDALQENDIFSVVAFDDRAEVLIPATRGQDKKYLKQRIQRLEAGGGTEIFQGLQAAFQQVSRFYRPDRLNNIILVTDGHTYGDDEKCYRLAEQAKHRGIVINGLGIGDKWNDAFLDRLTAITGGSAQLVLSARDIEAFLEKHIRGLSNRFAERVLLEYQLPEGVELRYAFRIAPDVAPIALEQPLVLGGVPREGSLQVLLEILVPPTSLEASQQLILQGVFSAHLPAQIPPLHQFSYRLTLPLKNQADLTPPPAELVEAMGRLTLYRIQERAQEDLAQGRVDQATRKLEQLASRLLLDGQVQLAQTIHQEIAQIHHTRRLSPAGQKAIKFGTRALLLPARIDSSSQEKRS